MSLKLPNGWAQKQTPRMYYGKFPHKLTLKKQFVMNHWEQYYEERDLFYIKAEEIAKNLLDAKGDTRRRIEYMSAAFFFENDDDMAKFIKNVKGIVDDKWTATVHSMTEEQVDVSALDAKVEHRKDLYHKEFAYRLHSKGGDDITLDALQAQLFSDEEIAEFDAKLEGVISRKRGFSRNINVEKYGRSITGSRARMQYGRSYHATIVYVKDECDAALARLILPNATTITKAVVVK